MIICYYKSRLTPIVCLPIWSLCPKENCPVTCPSPKWMDTGMSFLFIGQLPTWLKGILLRNGPGMHTIGDTRYNHWFDGLALLHSFTFKNGKLLHIRLKKAQWPKSWCLMLLILFWLQLALEWCRFRLQSSMSGEVTTAWGTSLQTYAHTSLATAAQEYLCRTVIRGRSCCPFFLECRSSVLSALQDSLQPALNRLLQGSLCLPPRARKPLLFQTGSTKNTVISGGFSVVDEQPSFREN